MQPFTINVRDRSTHRTSVIDSVELVARALVADPGGDAPLGLFVAREAVRLAVVGIRGTGVGVGASAAAAAGGGRGAAAGAPAGAVAAVAGHAHSGGAHEAGLRDRDIFLTLVVISAVRSKALTGAPP